MHKWEADILKNPCNSTGFYLNSHDCTFNHKYIPDEGRQANAKDHAESQGKPFSACLPPGSKNIFATNVISNV